MTFLFPVAVSVSEQTTFLLRGVLMRDRRKTHLRDRFLVHETSPGRGIMSKRDDDLGMLNDATGIRAKERETNSLRTFS